MIAAVVMTVASSCPATGRSKWGVGFELPAAISLHLAVCADVEVATTLPYSGPARFTLRERLRTIELGNVQTHLVLGAGAAAAQISTCLAWGTCTLVGVEVASHRFPVCLHANIVILLPWSPNVGGVTLLAEVGYRWDLW